MRCACRFPPAQVKPSGAHYAFKTALIKDARAPSAPCLLIGPSRLVVRAVRRAETRGHEAFRRGKRCVSGRPLAAARCVPNTCAAPSQHRWRSLIALYRFVMVGQPATKCPLCLCYKKSAKQRSARLAIGARPSRETRPAVNHARPSHVARRALLMYGTFLIRFDASILPRARLFLGVSFAQCKCQHLTFLCERRVLAFDWRALLLRAFRLFCRRWCWPFRRCPAARSRTNCDGNCSPGGKQYGGRNKWQSMLYDVPFDRHCFYLFFLFRTSTAFICLPFFNRWVRMFTLYDADGDGVIQRSEVRDVIVAAYRLGGHSHGKLFLLPSISHSCSRRL